MSELAAEIREAAARYPDRRSAILPALPLAQERYGWLSPAFCLSIASFYDMFHLQPVGRHLIEVCTNVCCGLKGAQGVLEAFERELGLAPGETSEDGAVTLRAVECLGGCAWPTVVAVDHRYRQNVTAVDVPGIVAEVRE